MITIKSMEEKDVHQVANIEKAIFSQPWSEKSIYDFLKHDYARFFTACDENTVTGYISSYIMADELNIINIAVDEKYRGRGIGEKLLKTVIETAVKENCLCINLEVRENNESAIRLYEKSGFVKLGIRKNFYSMPTENAIIYRYEFS